MDTVTAKILFFFLSIFILIIVAHQVALLFDDKYETETAILYSSAEKISFNGIYVRNEDVVTSNSKGVLSYPNTDGSKIAKDSVVAYVYKNENDIYINQQIDKLRAEAKLIEKEQSPGTTDVAQPEFISSLIDEKYQTITTLIAKNDLVSLAEERKNFQSLLGIYQIVIKEENNYDDKIESLNNQIAVLEKKQKQPIDVITVPNSGYFISYVDGYEDMLKPDKINDLTVDKIKDIISNDGYNSAKVPKNSVGKVVDDYNWKLIGVVNTDDAIYQVGQDVTVKLSSTPDTVKAKIEDILETDNPDESIIILSCEKLNTNLVKYRTERVELILNDYSGLKVPRNAIRFNKQNEKGVYVLLGQKIAFKKINIIFECNDYLLSGVTSDPSYVSIYDDIITNGEIPTEVIEQISEVTTTVESNDTSVETSAETSAAKVQTETALDTMISGDE